MKGSIRRGLAVSGFAVAASVYGFADAQTKVWTVNADFDGGNPGTPPTVCHGPNVAGQPKICADGTSDQLVLGRTPVSKADRVWADNYVSGWIIGLDVKTGKQISRFPSGLTSINGVPTGAQGSVKEGGKPCDFATVGDCPGRVTTDTNGDVWIINRAFGQQGTLSKFTTDKTHCIDRNGNGKIDTSSDVNGDGVINPDDPAEYFGQGDECIITTIPIGVNKALPRSVAVDKKGKIWVATHDEQKVYRINPNDPISIEVTIDLKANAKTTNVHPYSMASGKDFVFISSSSGTTVRIPIDATDATTLDTAPCPGTYGVVGDPSGTAAYLGGWFTGPGVYKADFTNHTCPNFATNGAAITAVTLDDSGVVWAAGYAQNVVFRMTNTGVLLGSYPGGTSPHGLSVDFFGNVWAIFHAAPFIKAFQPSGADLVLPVSPKLTAPPNYNYDPYLYSDFTGTQIDRQAPYTRVGAWTATYDVGANGVPWKSVAWNTEPQGATPPETTLGARVRAADDQATLGTSGYTPVTNGAALANVKGRYVQVEVDMTGPGYATPVLSDIQVTGPCGTVGDACCLQDTDCAPTNACDSPTCPTPGGACKHAPKPSCCLTSADCDDKNLCTKDSCPAPGGTCVNAKTAGCCNVNTDCDDGMPCTADLCSGPGGSCAHQTIFGCCASNADCKGSMCTTSTCPMPGGLCKTTPTAGCCNADKDCDDGEPCNVHSCDLTTKTCKPNTHIAGCCNVDMDCKGNDPCVQDTCTGKGGTCKHTTVPNCCSPTSPDVGQPCDVPTPPHDKAPCKAGKKACVMGMFVCDGSIGPKTQVCNGLAEDCTGVLDPNSCPSGLTCKDGNCVGPCKGGEFPCDPGFTCVGNLCVATSCSMVTCMIGFVCDPAMGKCVPSTGGTGGSSGAAGSAGTAGAAGKSGGAGSSATAGSGGATTGKGGNGTGGSNAAGSGVGGAAGKAGGATGGTGTAGTAAATQADSASKGGCGCEIPGNQGGGSAPAAGLVLAALAVLRLRARRREEGAS
jgi:hypothetical protein